jgi:hypothetical protein
VLFSIPKSRAFSEPSPTPAPRRSSRTRIETVPDTHDVDEVRSRSRVATGRPVGGISRRARRGDGARRG